MANLIKLDTKEYPVSVTEFKERHPNVSFGVQIPFADYGYAVVFPAPAPSFDSITQHVHEIAPVLTQLGTYQQAYEVLALDDGMIATNRAVAQAAFIEAVTNSAQGRLDDFAKTRNYDGILSACTYAASTVTKFQTEGQYCVNARDSTWATLYTVMGEVQAGTRAMPDNVAAVMALLPALVWPA